MDSGAFSTTKRVVARSHRPAPATQCVFDVRGKAVVVGQHGGNAALGPAAGAILQRALGHDGHAVCGRQVQRGREAGEAAAYDENVEVVRMLSGGCG